MCKSSKDKEGEEYKYRGMHVVELVAGLVKRSGRDAARHPRPEPTGGPQSTYELSRICSGQRRQCQRLVFRPGPQKEHDSQRNEPLFIKKVPLAPIECKARSLMIRAFGKVVVLSGRHEAKL